MNALMDQSPVAPRLAQAALTASAAAAARAPALLDSFLNACFSGVQRVLTAQSELLTVAERAGR